MLKVKLLFRSQVSFTTSHCNVPMSRTPLIYQLLSNTDEHMVPITRPQFNPTILIDSRLISDNNTRYSVEVCDEYLFCQTFQVSIESMDWMSDNEQNRSLTNDLSIRYQTFDPISALTLIAGQSVDSMSDQKSTTEEFVRMLSTITDSDIRHKGDLTLVYHSFGQIFRRTKDFETKTQLIDAIKRISLTTRIMADIKTLDILYTNVVNYHFDHENRIFGQINDSYWDWVEVSMVQNNNYHADIRDILAGIVSSCAKQVPIGLYVTLGSGVQLPRAVTTVTHQKRFYPIRVKTSLNNDRNISAVVEFNERKMNKYFNKMTTDNVMHNSLVYSLTLYPDQSPFAIPDDVHKLSPIVDISVHSPKSGQRLDIEWKPKTSKEEDFIALMRVTLTGNKTFGGSDYSTKCHYFSLSGHQWDQSGVIHLGISGQNGGCFMRHLAPLVLFRVFQHISANYVFGVLVAVMMGVLIFGIMVVFFVQKKEETLQLDRTDTNKDVHRHSYARSYHSYKDYNYT